jgi:hypothetical protein
MAQPGEQPISIKRDLIFDVIPISVLVLESDAIRDVKDSLLEFSFENSLNRCEHHYWPIFHFTSRAILH